MLRALLAAFVCLGLTACSGWVSDERLFGTEDWAHLDFAGPYENGLQNDDPGKHTILSTRPDGLIEGVGPGPDDRSMLGLVPIRGGSGDFFLAVDRSDESQEGDEYYIARLSNGNALAFFLPDCRGTSPVEGMQKVRDDRGGVAVEDADGAPIVDKIVEDQSDEDLVCKFTTKDALMTAGLEAERFLSAPHIVGIIPFATLEPATEREDE